MQTELSYVREKLIAAGRKTWPAIGKKTGVSTRTMRRIVEEESAHYTPHYGNVKKIELHFRTQERRGR
jgi:hypothetical protein